MYALMLALYIPMVIITENKFKGWKVVVLGKEGQPVVVNNEGIYYCVHPCQLMKVQNSSDTCQTKKIEDKKSGTT